MSNSLLTEQDSGVVGVRQPGRQLPTSRIEPPSAWPRLGLRELWRYRDLLVLLIWRDFSSRYRQSLIGVGWAVIRPVLLVLTFTLVIGRLGKFPSEGVPYPVFAFAGLLPWLCFSTCLTAASSSLVVSSSLLSKVYFPRLVLPLSAVGTSLIDFAIQLVLLVIFMACHGIFPTWRFLFLPALVLQCTLTALSVGLWTTAGAVRFRDLYHAVPFLVQLWMWATPVFYPASMVPERWRVLYSLNPMVSVVEGFRWALLQTPPPDMATAGASATAVLVVLGGGLYFFRKVEVTMADII
jgi:lipopolysaccharide transport system permease protein